MPKFVCLFVILKLTNRGEVASLQNLESNDWPSTKNSFQPGLQIPVTWSGSLLKGSTVGTSVFFRLPAAGNTFCVFGWLGLSALPQLHLLTAAGQWNMLSNELHHFMSCKAKDKLLPCAGIGGHNPLSNGSH